MTSGEDQEQVLNEVGTEILEALRAVAQAAQRSLSEGTQRVSVNSLANPSNRMVGKGNAEINIDAINSAARENLLRLMREPFVARVEVDWGRSQPVQTYYFSRASAAGLMGAIDGAHFVTSGAALGRLAEREAGDSATIAGREGSVVKRSVFRPTQQDGLWDALIRKFEALPWGDVLELLRQESLREALEGIKRERAGPIADEDILGRLMQEAATVAFERQRIRRKVVDRIALRDQPILDKFQGEIFRLPLDMQVMLFGPPGSGKTTTLIKRLAQKRTPDALTEGEEKILSSYIRNNLLDPNGWAMFSPAELLKQYLGEAFNQEGVPDAGNVRTWDKERHDLARNVLGILRSATSGRFQLESNPTLFADRSSQGIAKLHDEFATVVEMTLLNRCNDAVARLLKSNDESVKKSVLALQRTLGNIKQLTLNDIFNILDNSEGLQSEMRRLGDQISEGIKKVVNKLLNAHRKMLDEIVGALPTIKGEEEDETEDEIDEAVEPAPIAANARMEALNILMSALRNWARAIAEGRRRIGGQSGRVVEFLKERLPAETELANVGASIATRSYLRILIQAPRALVLGVPGMYSRFRRQAVREGRHFVASDATTDFLARNRISPDEADVLVLVMLRNARRIVQYPDGRRVENITPHDWLENIKSRYLMQVFVDEATDLSAVQLACTIELANPRLRSWFACGDLRQRITENGIQDRSELEWLNNVAGIHIDLREIDIGYRQSERLRDLADAVAALDAVGPVKTKAPRGSEEADVWPLLGENLSGNQLATWLAGHIEEVERGVGRLPSIAVFVDGDELIDPLVNATQQILAEHNIPIVGCKEGRVVGDAREVRVFDIQHIKGLEFEAVFFVGIDGLARRIPNLFQRFFYVGATRAATYLGLSCETELPEGLEPVRSHFRTDGWA